MATWHVQPWYDEGEDWPDEPGPAVLVEAPSREGAEERYKDEHPGDGAWYRIVKSRDECDEMEWNMAEKRATRT